jgi:hypothetical protein
MDIRKNTTQSPLWVNVMVRLHVKARLPSWNLTRQARSQHPRVLPLSRHPPLSEPFSKRWCIKGDATHLSSRNGCGSACASCVRIELSNVHTHFSCTHRLRSTLSLLLVKPPPPPNPNGRFKYGSHADQVYGSPSTGLPYHCPSSLVPSLNDDQDSFRKVQIRTLNVSRPDHACPLTCFLAPVQDVCTIKVDKCTSRVGLITSCSSTMSHLWSCPSPSSRSLASGPFECRGLGRTGESLPPFHRGCCRAPAGHVPCARATKIRDGELGYERERRVASTGRDSTRVLYYIDSSRPLSLPHLCVPRTALTFPVDCLSSATISHSDVRRHPISNSALAYNHKSKL